MMRVAVALHATYRLLMGARNSVSQSPHAAEVLKNQTEEKKKKNTLTKLGSNLSIPFADYLTKL
jgi:hypothetical protein